MTASDGDHLVVVGVCVDKKFTRRKKDNTAIVAFGIVYCTLNGQLVRQSIIGHCTILGDIIYLARHIRNGFGKIVITTIGEVWENGFCARKGCINKLLVCA